MAPPYLKGDGPAVMRAKFGPCYQPTGPCGGIGVYIGANVVGVPPGGPSGSVEYVYDTTTHTGDWNCDPALTGFITNFIWGGFPLGFELQGDIRATYRFQTLVIRVISTPTPATGGPSPWNENYGSAAGSTDTLTWKWTIRWNFLRSLSPVEIVAEAGHLGGIWYHWINDDGAISTLVDTGVPLHGFAVMACDLGTVIGAKNESGGTGHATFDVTNPRPGPGHEDVSAASNSVYEAVAAYPAGSSVGGDSGYTYSSQMLVDRSDICSIAVGGNVYNACKEILDLIDLGDLSKTYTCFSNLDGTVAPTQLQMHTIYKIFPFWTLNPSTGLFDDGKLFKWGILSACYLWNDDTDTEQYGPNGPELDPGDWDTYKTLLASTNDGGLLCAQNQWVQGFPTNLGSTSSGALILSKARCIEDVLAGHVFYPERRPQESLGWNEDTGFFPSVLETQFPFDPVPCHSVGTGDLRFGVPGEGVGIIFRRCQHAYYFVYDPVLEEEVRHERPPCYNWHPCIRCEEGI